MSKVKKIILFIVGLIAIIAIGLFSYLQFRISAASKGLVYYQSSSVICINTDAILKDIAWNALKNPSYYFSSSGVDSTSSKEKIDLGIALPAQVYFFSVDSSETYYTHQKISNLKQFKQSLSKYLKIDSIDFSINQYYHSKDNRLAVVFNNQEVLVSFAPTKKSDSDKMKSLWENRSKMFFTVKDLEELDAISTNEADVVYYDLLKQSKSTVNFENGNIQILGNLFGSDIRLATEPKARELQADNILNFYCHGDLRAVFKKYENVLSSYNIPIDTLSRYYGSYLDVQWSAGEVVQQDTIVSYDYDDNFEMTEKKEVRSIQVPNITVLAKASPHLAPYLPEKVFYKFNKQVKGDLIELTTSDHTGNDRNQLSNVNTALLLTFKPDRTTKDLWSYFPIINKLKSVVMEANQMGDGQLEFKGNIALEKSNIHALYYLLR